MQQNHATLYHILTKVEQNKRSDPKRETPQGIRKALYSVVGHPQ